MSDARDHEVVEQRTIFTLRCGGCSKTWEVRGARHDDLSASDLEDGLDESCPHCGVTRVVMTGDEERDRMIALSEDTPCRATFERWVVYAPERLLALLRAGAPREVKTTKRLFEVRFATEFVVVADDAQEASRLAETAMSQERPSIGVDDVRPFDGLPSGWSRGDIPFGYRDPANRDRSLGEWIELGAASQPFSWTPVLLGDAAEIAGGIVSDEMREALSNLLVHESLFVREGAVYGLRDQLAPELRERLKTMRENEPSEAVRAAIDDVLS